VEDLACSESGISPISSSISVPPCATSNLPGFVPVGAGERAFLMSEQLALEELAGMARS